MQQPILIAGAGIGGLALAAGLRRHGIPCRVFEKAPAARAIGWGLGLAPNGMLALRKLGLDQAALAAGAPIEAGEIRTAGGKLLREMAVGPLAERLGAPAVAIARARLHALLLGDTPVAFGREVVEARNTPDGATLRFADGTEATGALVVGGDGVGSAVVRAVAGDVRPRDAGYVAYRGLAPAGDALPAGRAMLVLGAGQRFGAAHVGEGQVYWFACFGTDPGADGLAAAFTGWHAPVRDLIAATPADRVIGAAMADRAPLRSWHRGRIALLGDAAHPMTPDMGQGACQALEDAVALADALAAEPDVARALAKYEAARLDRAAWVVARSRQIGKLEQARNPLICGLRDLAYAWAPEGAILGQLSVLAAS